MVQEAFTSGPGGIYQWSRGAFTSVRGHLPVVQGGILQWSRPTSSVVNSSATTEEFLPLDWSRLRRPDKCLVKLERAFACSLSDNNLKHVDF